jgi:hypothetical protein
LDEHPTAEFIAKHREKLIGRGRKIDTSRKARMIGLVLGSTWHNCGVFLSQDNWKPKIALGSRYNC